MSTVAKNKKNVIDDAFRKPGSKSMHVELYECTVFHSWGTARECGSVTRIGCMGTITYETMFHTMGIQCNRNCTLLSLLMWDILTSLLSLTFFGVRGTRTNFVRLGHSHTSIVRAARTRTQSHRQTKFGTQWYHTPAPLDTHTHIRLQFVGGV